MDCTANLPERERFHFTATYADEKLSELARQVAQGFKANDVAVREAALAAQLAILNARGEVREVIELLAAGGAE